MLSLPRNLITQFHQRAKSHLIARFSSKQRRYRLFALIDLACLVLIIFSGFKPATQILSPLISPVLPLRSLTSSKPGKEVFGFAPYWNLNKLSDVNFDILTTFAYFGIPVNGDGSLAMDDQGAQDFYSKQATDLFKQAHAHNTRVVLTLTQMKNGPILALMDDPNAQQQLIDQAVQAVKDRGIDGINVDMEYAGDPGQDYRDKFSEFIKNLTEETHRQIPESRVTVSVYASAVKDPKIYDIHSLGQNSDGIFMMAYDFAVAGSDNAIPTAPLYGYKQGAYWYDISTAVSDFLTQTTPDKLILGVPYYGYNYAVYQPSVKAETLPTYSWRGQPATQTYTVALANVNPGMDGIDDYKEGWDDYGQVGYKAYHVVNTDTWRIIFLENARSLSAKYDFAKSKDLAGVGIWALGMDNGHPELWGVLASKFGTKLADASLTHKLINDVEAAGY